jgi:hypothetical protein
VIGIVVVILVRNDLADADIELLPGRHSQL